MALSEPFDILADFPGWTTVFDLQYRQEQSRVAGGRTYVKDLGDPLWKLSAQSKTLKPNALDYWKARLRALENGIATLKGYPLSRCYPILYPNGVWPTGASFTGHTGTLHTVNANRKAIRVGGLPPGYKVSIGDMFRLGTSDLHGASEAAVADASGLTPEFEVRPHIWPGVSGGGSVAVSVKRPHCLMAIIPGSIDAKADASTGRGVISFEAIEAR